MRKFLCASAAMVVMTLASGAWANGAPFRPPPSDPVTRPSTQPATKPSKSLGFVVGGVALSALLAGSGLYAVRRSR